MAEQSSAARPYLPCVQTRGAFVGIPVIVNADSGIVNSDSADREHTVGAKRR
jgi:hypothetical protein